MQKPDELWKGIIEALFEEFVEFFMFDLYPNVDFSKGYEFLDKELATIFPEAEEEKRHADKLVKVFLRDGRERWILIHIEVQGYRDKGFTKRMFMYFYRIYDRYAKEIIAIAIFTDDKKAFKPQRFEYSFYNTKLLYEYRTYKILDADEDELKQSANPFALVVLAGLYAIKSGKSADKKYTFKRELLRLLLKKGYDKEKIRQIFLFLDKLLLLPEDLEIRFREEIEDVKGGEEGMGLSAAVGGGVSKIIYEEGFEKGVEKGVEKGLQEGIEALLEVKFNIEGLSLMDAIRKIEDVEQLEGIKETIRRAKTIDEVKDML